MTYPKLMTEKMRQTISIYCVKNLFSTEIFKYIFEYDHSLVILRSREQLVVSMLKIRFMNIFFKILLKILNCRRFEVMYQFVVLTSKDPKFASIY